MGSYGSLPGASHHKLSMRLTMITNLKRQELMRKDSEVSIHWSGLDGRAKMGRIQMAREEKQGRTNHCGHLRVTARVIQAEIDKSSHTEWMVTGKRKKALILGTRLKSVFDI